MTLAHFINDEMESILAEWEAFARTRTPAASKMSALALRDHSREILRAIAFDLSKPQTSDVQTPKSKGNATVPLDRSETAAQTHAAYRARDGFDINQLAPEYRALRASVLRLWLKALPPEKEHLQDIIHFNEAIDQALAESIERFSAQVDHARDLLLGMLGHDMRTPLNALLLTAQFLLRLNTDAEVTEAAASMIRSGASMKVLLDDLMDFNRIKLGLGVDIEVANADVGVVCADEIKQQLTANPDRHLELNMVGDTKGVWDAVRLQQVLRNLVSNAFKYGHTKTSVIVNVVGEKDEVTLEVHNHGPNIASAALERIFDPLTRGVSEDGRRKRDGSLGLGLYIVREIVRSHGGEVTARSNLGETVFVVRLPRVSVPKLAAAS